MDNIKKHNLNNDLTLCLQSLDSHKITERKVKRQEIQQLLENDEVVEVLNLNSQQSQRINGNDGLVTWKCLLNCCHRSLILEVEKEDIKRQKLGIDYKQPNLESCSNLLKNIIIKANKEHPYLPSDDLLKCILDVSQNDTFQLFMGEIYYKILEQNIISQSYYWHSLSGHWNDLFSLAYKLYAVDFSNMKHTSIKLMKHIVDRGDAHSNVTLSVKKKIFLYLKKAIMDTLQVKNDFSLREDLIILSFVVCKTIGLECRKSLCQFIEESCTYFINLYEIDRSKKVQEQIYHLLTFFIKVHHPKCVGFNHKVFYALNEKTWIVQLYQIYEFVCREIQLGKNNSNPNFSNYISKLAVSTFYMVYFNQLDTFSLTLDECSAPKRKKSNLNFFTFIDNLPNLKSSEVCTRLHIITKLLENHPLPFSEIDFINLLQCMTKCINSCKDANSIKHLIICCNSLVKSDNIKKILINKIDQIESFFKTVWTFILKSIISNENQNLSHNLLQSLIELNNWHSEMYSDILRPYLNKTVKIDNHSLKTLIILFKTRGFCSVSLNKTNMILLLDWLLPIKVQNELSTFGTYSKVNPYYLTEVVDLILTKPSINKSLVNHSNFTTLSSSDFTDEYFYLGIQKIPKINLKVTKSTGNKSTRRSIDENIFQILTNFIKQTLLLEEKPSILALQFFFSLTNFICFLESQFPQFSNECSIFGSYKYTYMDKVKNIVSELKDNANQLNNEEFVNVCLLFYQELQLADDQIVNKVLNHEANKVITIKLYNFSKLNDSNNEYKMLNFNSLTKKQILSIKSNEVLLNMCVCKGKILNDKISLIDILIEDLIKLEDTIHMSYTYYKLTSFLRLILSLDNLPIALIVQTNKFIKQLAKNWCYHQEGFIQITQLICDALCIITKNYSNTVCTSNLLMIIWSLQKISTTKKCGPAMICAFVNLLGHFASKHNGSFGYTWNINTNIVKPMSPENILHYINNPFFQVRLSVIKYIKVMCDAYENDENAYIISYEEMFDVLLHNIHEVFTVDSNINEEEHADEYTNRVATYLLCVQVLLISSKQFRKKCLFEILQTFKDKKIMSDLVINMLEGVAVELKIKSYMTLVENNLNFLLWNWHLKYSSFKDFPFELLLCTTMEQFLKKYQFEIIPILVIKNDLNLLNSLGILCKGIEDNFSAIFSYLLAIKIENDPILSYDEVKNVIENILGEEHFNELIKSQYSDIVLKCIQMVVTNIEHPIAPIQIDTHQFLSVINIFQETYVKSKNPFLIIMSKRQPSYVQFIVHTLYVNIFKKSTTELRFQSFFQYTFFMKHLIAQMSECSDIDEFTYFLAYQSVRSTVTLISQNDFELHDCASSYLEWLLTNTQKFLKLNISEIQPLVTSTLRVLAKNQLLANEKISNLLNILKTLSSQSMSYEVNYENSSLHENITDFLSQQNENVDLIQSLQCLKLKLKSNEKELQNMYEQLFKMRGFSEDCVKSTLHCFICTLIQLTKNSDYEIQILAASCLGILGPADLTTLLLQPEPEVLKLDSNISPEFSFILHVATILLNYLSDSNINVMEASNITLFKIMATHKGQSIYEKLGKNVLYPFKPEEPDQDMELSFDIEQFNLIIDVEEIWCPIDYSISYNNWVTRLTKKLLETFQGFSNNLLPIAENKPLFGENILPQLIYFIAMYNPLTRSVLNKHINCFFIKHSELKREKSTEKIKTNFIQAFDVSDNNIYNNKSALQCLLNVINFIRLQQESPLQIILHINYLYVSQAAQFCSAHFTSILYLELWCEMEFNKRRKDHWSMAFNPVDMISEILPENGLLLQSILNESYKSIGDSDAVEGCGSSYLLNPSSRTQYYQVLKKWDRVMENCDLQQTSEIITKDYLEAFSNSGLQNIAYVMSPNNNSLKYDYSWQLDKWDLPDNGDKSFEALHYHSMRYIHQKNFDAAMSMINEARLKIVESLSYTSLESTATIYSPLAKLKIIEDLEDFISMPNKNMLFEKWLNLKTLRTNDFVNINKILNQRSKLMDFDGDNRSGILRLNLAEVALKNNWLQEAGRNLAVVVSLQYYQKHTILWAKVEEARLLWQRDDCHMAKILLKFVVEELDSYEYPFLHSLALQLYGSWMEETKSETSNDIIKKYFQKSIKILQPKLTEKQECGLQCKKVISDAHKRLSQFSDTLYQQISKYTKTDDLKKRIHEVEDDKKKGKALLDSARSTNNTEKMKAGLFLMNQSNLDKSDISNINVEKIRYLKIALQNYLQLMMLDDKSELPVYRVISLWLENKENSEINSIVDQELNKNPTYKFIMVLPQLVAHLSFTHEHKFHTTLENLLNRCAIEHPYQTIPIVYAVANSNIDQAYIKSKQSTTNKEEPRVLAAKRLMSNWKKNSKISSIVMNTETLYEALIRLAYTKFKCSPGQRALIPDDQPLMKIQNFNNIMYPAATLLLNKNGIYSNIIGINNFKNSFLNAGGVHQPKKIDCLCSDGNLRSLLLKSNEDMRQDAVMQQVFLLMNRLLQSNKSTVKRKLTIRTYKVIPFSQQSGIAEWCVNTISLGDYLVGKDSNLGAHQKYRPDDMLPSEARACIRSSKENGDSQFARLKKYLDVCKKIKPVFRYFFLEKFLSPSIWFERRQAFTHSVATTSMVGYILGLGDRHVQNILIDNNTAELIHIDFGIAFDQGTLLSTPETVPFRLTRDIVDGMGICGIEGTFRKCCEKTMSVLRQNRDVIVTVIEVLIYDPCYHWTLTEEKAAQLQNRSTIENSNTNSLTEVNKLAERSLNKIRVKLCGIEEVGSTATVNGQVNRLIQQARDPANLSLLFHGWQAYL